MEGAPAENSVRELNPGESVEFSFFIAHAKDDADLARQLYHALQPDPCALDQVTVGPGSEWQGTLADAQAASRVTVILLSRSVGSAYYLKEEIARAIDLMRREGHKVVPVFLDGFPKRSQDVPYGLYSLNGVDSRKLGPRGVAEHLRSVLNSVPTNAAPLQSPTSSVDLVQLFKLASRLSSIELATLIAGLDGPLDQFGSTDKTDLALDLVLWAGERGVDLKARILNMLDVADADDSIKADALTSGAHQQRRAATELEVERKFAPPASHTMKLTDVVQSSTIFHQIAGIAALLGIPASELRHKHMVDYYFDDERGTLGAEQCTLRVRTWPTFSPNRSPKLTLKAAHPQNARRNELHRIEYSVELPQSIFGQNGVIDVEALSMAVSDFDDIMPSLMGPLKHRVTVNTKRRTASLATNGQVHQYELCVDSFFYRSPRGAYSHRMLEVEIEAKGEHPQPHLDEQIQSLYQELQNLLNLRPHQVPKGTGGIAWVEAPDSIVETKHCLALELCGQFNEDAELMQQLQGLNYHVKHAARRRAGQSEVWLQPMANGVVVISGQFQDLDRLLDDLVQRLERECVRHDRRIVFRGGVCSGPVFRYSTADERYAYGGFALRRAIETLHSAQPGEVRLADNRALPHRRVWNGWEVD